MPSPLLPTSLWFLPLQCLARLAFTNLAMAGISGCVAASELTDSATDAVASPSGQASLGDSWPCRQDDAAPHVDGSQMTDAGNSQGVCAISPGGSWRRATLLVLPPKHEGCDLDADGKSNNALASVLSSLLATFNARLQAELDDSETQWLVRLQPDLSVELYRGRIKTTPQNCPAAICNAEVLANLSAGPNGDPCAPLAKLWLQVQSPDGIALAHASTATLATGWKEVPIASLTFLALKANTNSLKWEESLDSGMVCGAMGYECYGNGMKGDYDRSGDGIKDSVSFAVEFKTAPVAVTTP